MTYKEKIIKIQEVLNEPTEQEAAPVAQTTDWSKYPNFKPSEFVCSCGKCQYSKPEGVANLNPHLLDFLQFLRNYYKKAVTITCGVRCQAYNDSLKGSIKNSKHISLDAADFYIAGVTSTESGRDTIVAMAKALPYYGYAYHNKKGSAPNMGSAVHFDALR